MGFIHLHSHTQYSIKDALNKIPDYVAAVKADGQTACAITDHGVMYGCVEFYHACEKAGIKPIVGSEVYVAPDGTSRFEKDPDNHYEHLVLLAKDMTGYNNLSAIVTEGCIGDGFYYKPRVDDAFIEAHKEGLVCLSACLAGRIPKHLLSGDYDGAKAAAEHYRDVFGEDFYLEIQDHGLPEQKTVISGILRIHTETGIPVVATNDCHYTKKEDKKAHNILLCMAHGKGGSTLEEVGEQDKTGQWYVKTEEEMRKLFSYIPEAIENTNRVADKCNLELKFHETKMPKFPVPEGMTEWEYLNELCEKGFADRYGSRSEEEKKTLHDALTYQLSVIEKMGYVAYFLIVQDYCNWARDNGVSVGPGRGSAAGSLVTYCLGITDIEPTQYDLQFERFLNPERVSMPDIDVDFDVKGRMRVVEHCKEVYGKDALVQIITFGRMEAKAVIKDVGKVLGYDYAFRDKLSKLVPAGAKSLSEAIETVPELKTAYETDRESHILLEEALTLEGLPKSTGKHAAGVIISDKPTREYIPLAKATDGTGIVSQYTMTAVEELGLLKMDFLGLRTLSVIKDACANIKKNQGKDFSISDIDYEDPEVFKFIGTGKTEGVFQLESKGMQDFMKKLKPTCIEDLIAGVSLYRPGPMDYIPSYIEGKRHPDRIKYDTPALEPILKATYGCIVYQEQVTRIVRDLAGYSMGAADNIRRAMSKKKQYVIDEERETFVHGDAKRNIPGCVKNGIDEATANRIYDHMVDFAKYAFNKSHAACYAIISYQTAYIMRYFPTEYFAATLTSVTENSDKLTHYIQSVKARRIRLLPPDINVSDSGFTAEGKAIRCALTLIKGVSEETAEEVIKERRKGKFTKFSNALDRLKDILDKKAIENLVDTGAFDAFEGSRAQKVSSFEMYLNGIKKKDKNAVAGQISLFDLMDGGKPEVSYPDIPDYAPMEKLEKEKEAAGVYISGHPLDEMHRYIEKYTDFTTDRVTPPEEEDRDAYFEAHDARDGQEITMVCLLKEVKKHYTKKNDPMAFLTIEDLYGSVEAVDFPKTYQKNPSIAEDDVVLLKGHLQIDAEKVSVIAEEIKPVTAIPKRVWLNVKEEDAKKAEKSIEKRENGIDRVGLFIQETKEKRLLPKEVQLTEKDVQALERKYGKKNVYVAV